MEKEEGGGGGGTQRKLRQQGRQDVVTVTARVALSSYLLVIFSKRNLTQTKALYYNTGASYLRPLR